ncbi:enoyl-ACP reductase FabI [Thermoleophilum album]|uniref:Enoyl-[acyl-carrier-protein] reductase [NADH] n=1 Tax=Thermoleophilum album TaxID=29539 RepID=A0A1H6FPW4_THEAL|nr:enoyl-ACP reductase FabI [Thermoleophilum album]SEH12392.1 Enoyl-[acyl-carrier-protein] reductase [NADH] [Thermoleophilum album]
MVDHSERQNTPVAPGLLAGKRLLITGVVTRQSIAFAVAERAQRDGATIALTSFGRARRLTERAARRLPEPPPVLEFDASQPSHYEELRRSAERTLGRIDGVLHAIAFAPPDALGGSFLTTPAESAELAFRISSWSLPALGAALQPLLERPASIVALDFDASVAWPVYDWMGVAKAALESGARYLARYLGPHGVRVNLVSAGPVRTVAASGIPGFSMLADLWRSQAPLGWDVGDPGPVADTVAFLLSDLSRGISGEIIHVDGGYHAMGAPLVERGSEEFERGAGGLERGAGGLERGAEE